MRTFDQVDSRRTGAADPGVDAASRHAPAGRAGALVLLLTALVLTARAEPPPELPPFTHTASADWLNGPPPAGAALRGHPVLLEVWTYGCSNCLASLPWLQRIAASYRPRGLAVVGVHSPETRAERDPAQVAAAVRRLGIGYPVMLDADFSYWRALDNRYWPAFYLYDAHGQLVAARVGELHAGEPSAQAFERLIAAQRAAPADGR